MGQQKRWPDLSKTIKLEIRKLGFEHKFAQRESSYPLYAAALAL